MIARLWWKEWRVFRPLFALVLLLALGSQALAVWSGDPSWRGAWLLVLGLSWSVIYALAVTAPAFAGEREEDTLRWLDTVPVSRPVLWAGKASFAFASSATLALVLALVAAAWAVAAPPDPAMVTAATMRHGHGGLIGYDRYGAVAVGFGALLLEAIAWGLFWSSLMRRALSAAVLAVVCVCTVSGGPAFSTVGSSVEDLARTAVPRLALAALLAPASFWLLARRPRAESPVVRVTVPSVRRIVARLRIKRAHSAGRSIAWATRRELLRIWPGLILPWLGAASAWAVWVERRPLWTLPVLAVSGAVASLLAGVNVFHGEHRSRTYRVYVHHGVSPARVWWVKTGTWVWFVAVPAALAAWLITPVSWIPPDARAAA